MLTHDVKAVRVNNSNINYAQIPRKCFPSLIALILLFISMLYMNIKTV